MGDLRDGGQDPATRTRDGRDEVDAVEVEAGMEEESDEIASRLAATQLISDKGL